MKENGGTGILLHLWAIRAANEDDDIAPTEATQPGIARALGTSRPHVTVWLGRLCAAGYVAWRMAHVRGKAYRVKAYRLTTAGFFAIDRGPGGIHAARRGASPRTGHAPIGGG